MIRDMELLLNRVYDDEIKSYLLTIEQDSNKARERLAKEVNDAKAKLKVE